MKKIILIFTMMLAVAGVQAQSVHKLYATPMQVSGNSNISWNESTNQFSVTGAGANTYDIFNFPAGTLSKYEKIYIKISNTTDRVLFMNGTTIAFTWSGFGSTGQRDQTLVGLNSNSKTLSAETIATITSIRIAGPGSGASITTPYTISLNPAETYLYTASCEAMEITTTIDNSSSKDTPFAWTATGTLSTIGNNLGKTTSGTIFGYGSNNDAAHGVFDVTGYDQVQLKLASYNSSNSKDVRLLDGTVNNAHMVFNALENVFTYAKPVGSFTTCSSVKAGQGDSNSQDVTSIKFSKYFAAYETTAFSIAASANSTVAYDRTFTAGQKSTVCLPFALTQDEANAAGTFYEMTAADNEKVTFTEVTSGGTTAYKPYIFKAKETGTPYANLTNKAIEASAGATTSYTVSSNYTFKGTLAASADVAGDNTGYTVYGYSTAGNFVKVGTGVSIKAFRGYITIPSSSPAPSFLNIDFIDGGMGGTTGISEVKSTNANDGVMYNLQGQRVGEGHKGLVIKNGKKVMMK